MGNWDDAVRAAEDEVTRDRSREQLAELWRLSRAVAVMDGLDAFTLERDSVQQPDGWNHSRKWDLP